MLPKLNHELRQAIEAFGEPLPLCDEKTGQTYVLMKTDVTPDLIDGFSARIPGIAAYGAGETEQEASLALCEALRGYMNAFS